MKRLRSIYLSLPTFVLAFLSFSGCTPASGGEIKVTSYGPPPEALPQRDAVCSGQTMLLLGALFLLLSVAVILLIRWLLLRRVDRLTRITRSIAEGNLTRRLNEPGKDKLSLLAWNVDQMADRLAEKILELKEEGKKKELFVAAFSHELKTPLTSIIGYSDLLRSKDLDPEQRHVCADYIFQEGKRLERLSMRLLDLIVLKQHDLRPEPTEIGWLLSEVIRLMTSQFTEHGIELICEVEPAVLDLEPELMKTVFINLLDNARKAIDGPGKIILTGQHQQNGYLISIQDSGRGMKKQELPRITDAFYTVSKAQGGSGLGLAICQEILLLHGFSLAFDSVVGVGTLACVTIPAPGSN